MKNFEFNGDWQFDHSLPTLAKLNSNKFFPPSSSHGKKLAKGKIPIIFGEKYDDTPDPSNEQLNTLQWIDDNQDYIFDSLFNHIKNKIYPFYLSEIDFDEDWFPPLNNISDLTNVLGIENLVIDTNSKNGISFVYYTFQFSVDDEHGIVIILHETDLIGFDQIGSIDDQKIIEDLGLDYNDYETLRLEEYEKREFKFHSPHPKYGKLKKWQKLENEKYPYELIRKNQFEKFKNFINQNNINIDGNGLSFLTSAIISEDHNLIEFCLNKKPKKLFTPFKYALSKDKYEVLDKILSLGFNLNESLGNSSLLYSLFKSYERNFQDSREIEKIEKRIEFLFSKKINPYLIDQYNQNAFHFINYFQNKVTKRKLLNFLHRLTIKYKMKELDLKKFLS